MRAWLGVHLVVLATACGRDDEPSAEPGEATGTGSSSSAEADGSTATETDSDLDPSFDHAQCAIGLSGTMDWTVSLPSSSERGGGTDLVPGPDDTLYVIDDCLSRWSLDGWRQWEVREPAWTCKEVELDAGGEPVVVGWRATPRGPAPLVVGFDAEGERRWELPVDETEPPPEQEPQPTRLASDLVVDREGRIFVTGLRLPVDVLGEPNLAWVSLIDPSDGHEVWTYLTEGNAEDLPRLVLAHDRVVLAEPRRNDVGIDHVVLTTLEPDGQELARWSSLDALGLPLRLLEADGDVDGWVLLAGHDPSVETEPTVLVLLEPSGGTRWVRSGLDLPWLNETVETVALDPCGAVVLAGAGDPEAADWGSLWVTKLDRSAEPRWSVFLPSPYFHRSTLVHGLYIEPDGGVLGTGAQVTGVQDLDGDTVVLLDAWAGRLLP
ncbi:MAG: hypothetical protein KC501_33920 [Myxococcales bacterium]|nr:hypothetical protein [Myxococcales bacterium]